MADDPPIACQRCGGKGYIAAWWGRGAVESCPEAHETPTMTPTMTDEPPFDSLVLIGEYSDGTVTYTITAATADGVPVEPDLADLFDLVLDRLGGSPCDE